MSRYSESDAAFRTRRNPFYQRYLSGPTDDDWLDADIGFDDLDREDGSLADGMSFWPAASTEHGAPPGIHGPQQDWAFPLLSPRSASQRLEVPQAPLAASQSSEFDLAAEALLAQRSWERWDDEDRFTFPPPVAPRPSSIAPMAMEDAAATPVRARTWRSALVGLGAALATTLLVLFMYAGATDGLSASWGTGWRPSPPTPAEGMAATPQTAPASELDMQAPEDPAPTLAQASPQQRATAALDAVAIRVAESCGRKGMAAASVRVVATFDQEGQVQSALVEGRPSPVGRFPRCVGELVRSARVDPFQGDPVTVSRTIQVPSSPRDRSYPTTSNR